MQVQKWTEKLNKVDGNIYSIEEEVHLVNGVYEADLQHDNINMATFAVYTGSKLTGDKIETYALSTPSLTPWKRRIRVYASTETVYLSYETDGDTVEADDINLVQEAVTETQEALNAETARAGQAEKALTDNLVAEADRAKAAEKVLTDNLSTEISRAKAAEKTNADSITAETARAKAAEKTLTDNLSAESARAAAAEKINAGAIATETTRAVAKEKELQGNIDAHTSAVAGEIQSLKAADATLDTKKADVSYVNTELGKRYTKEQVYTREEVLQKIKDLIGTAPETLDTFKEIADALGNDPNFAATIMNALAGKVDKVSGKQLTTNDYSNAEKAIVANVDSLKHTHGNKAVIDKLTQVMLDNLSAAYTHISDAVGHITAAERANWNDANTRKHDHGNKVVIDKITQALLDNWNGAYTHISDAVKHITAAERTNWTDAYNKRHDHANKTLLDGITQALLDTWNTVSNKVDKVSGKGLSANDYTTGDKDKLKNLIDYAIPHIPTQLNAIDLNQVVPDTYPAGYYFAGGNNNCVNLPAEIDCFGLILLRSASGYYTQLLHDSRASANWWWSRICTDKTGKVWTSWRKISDGGNAETVDGKHADAFASSSHSHTKSQISDMPTNLSQFTNGPGYITAKDVDTSQNHTHSNKTILDKLTQVMLDKLAGIEEGANKYVHSTASGNKHIPSGGASGQFLKWGADGTAVWAADNNTTYNTFGGATAAAGGSQGLVPGPAAGAQAKYLRADGTWQTPPDTAYTHPNSGATAGVYRSVTVNAQGHVTAGTNPTTLAGYGITDAAAGTHNHDSVYLKKGATTWGSLKGV